MFLSFQSQVFFILEKADHGQVVILWARKVKRGRRNCPLRVLRLTSVRSGWGNKRDSHMNLVPASEGLLYNSKPGVSLFPLWNRAGPNKPKSKSWVFVAEQTPGSFAGPCNPRHPEPESGASPEENRKAQERWGHGHQPRAFLKGKCQSELTP